VSFNEKGRSESNKKNIKKENMNLRKKTLGVAVVGTLGVITFASMVGAQTSTSTSTTATSTPLGVYCSGNVSSSAITWMAVATGGTAPYRFSWSGDSNIAGATSPSVTANYVANGTYIARITAMDVVSSTASSTCSGTITSFSVTTSTPPAPTSTVPQPFINQSTLSIGGEGQFLARGMRVTSVASTSFQAQIWGITYTVNWGGELFSPLEFWFRFDHANSTSTPRTQINVGDEVGVAGRIVASSSFIVNASVVRDYSITTPRHDHDHDDDQKDNGDHHDDKHEDKKDDQSNARDQLKNLMQRLQKLQDMFRNREQRGSQNNSD
jgi:hypothetical protein